MKIQGKTDDELLDKYGKLIEKRRKLRNHRSESGTEMAEKDMKLERVGHKIRQIENYFQSYCDGSGNCEAVMHLEGCYNGSNA